jgi:CubicO group peptidase (beta-lactamase class C family)
MSINIKSSKLDKFLKEAFLHYNLPGLAVHAAIEREDYFFVHGLKNAVTGSTLNPDHIFHLASITKLFTGTSILMLCEEGLLDLDEYLTTYLPGFSMADERYKTITLRNMLAHTSGLGDVKNYNWENPEIDHDALNRYTFSSEISNSHLLWSPEEGKYSYSNIAYNILGSVVESVTNLSFEEYISLNIFGPLNMIDSDLFTYRQDMKRLCSPHRKINDNRFSIIAHFPYNRVHSPSSTLTSTLKDMSKWARAVMEYKILSPKVREEAWRPHSIVPDNNENICLSWFKREQNNCTLYGHEGSDDGFRSSFWICPSLSISILVCANLSGAPVKRINRQIFDFLTASL